jgi:hypothetical protein
MRIGANLQATQQFLLLADDAKDLMVDKLTDLIYKELINNQGLRDEVKKIVEDYYVVINNQKFYTKMYQVDVDIKLVGRTLIDIGPVQFKGEKE